ncbi:MAG: hypothetical protein ACHQ50_11245 [Fimbriimonadales bacterium]
MNARHALRTLVLLGLGGVLGGGLVLAWGDRGQARAALENDAKGASGQAGSGRT